MKSLQDVLTYKNDRVLKKFTIRFAVSQEDAAEIHREMLKWLWLCSVAKVERSQNKAGVPNSLNIHTSMTIIDELWHVFVLHTKDYRDFCENYLGTFVHHNPSHSEFHTPSVEETELQLSYIYDKLDGDVTLLRWYEEYSVKYSPEKISALEMPYQYGRPCQA